MPAALFSRVQVLRIAPVHAPQGDCHGGLTFRDGNQVDVIEHQAVSHDAKACFGAVECQQIEIHAPIGIRKKGSLPVRAALG